MVAQAVDSTRVDAAARPTAHVPPEQLAFVRDSIAEVTPMLPSGEAEDDELDDEI